MEQASIFGAVEVLAAIKHRFVQRVNVPKTVMSSAALVCCSRLTRPETGATSCASPDWPAMDRPGYTSDRSSSKANGHPMVPTVEMETTSDRRVLMW